MKALSKALLVTTLTTSCVVTPALASAANATIASQEVKTATANVDNKVVSSTDVKKADVDYAFGKDANVQAKNMNKKDMEQTQGAFWGFIIRAVVAGTAALWSKKAH